MKSQASDWRVDLREGPLELGADPMAAFQTWLQEAVATPVPEPTAMTLATADIRGRPHARIVLFKGTSLTSGGQLGVEFYTNFTSPKSRDLLENPFAALVFHWPQLRRQIRFEGAVERLRQAESNIYFQSRARGSRVGAWSSPQSQPIASRETLKSLVAEMEARFAEAEIPCPPFWGGWRLLPERIEFWEERPHRLHERRSYTRAPSDDSKSDWTLTRLAP